MAVGRSRHIRSSTNLMDRCGSLREPPGRARAPGRQVSGCAGAILGVVVLVAATGPAIAAAPTPQLGGLPAGETTLDLRGGLSVGYERLDGADLLSTQVLSSLRWRWLRLGFDLRLRLDPVQSRLRPEDWDEPAEVAGIVRVVELAGPGDPLHLQLGPVVSASLGHGTLVNQFMGSLDPDHRRLGGWLDGQVGRVGAEALLDDLFEPAVVGARLSWRPWGEGAGQGPTERFVVGVSWAADLQAPRELAVECPAQLPGRASGGCPGLERYRLDPAGRPLAAVTEQLMLAGLDLSLGLIREPRVEWLIYSDLNGILEYGRGVHVGLLLTTHPTARVTGGLRLEYRYAGAGYQPGYFDTRYSLERYGVPSVPRLAALADQPAGSGFYGELALVVESFCSLAAIYELQQGEVGGTLTLRAELPGPGILSGGLLFQRAALTSPDHLFAAGGSLWMVELRAQLTALLYLEGYYAQLWRVAAPPLVGELYRSVHLGGLAVGASVRF